MHVPGEMIGRVSLELVFNIGRILCFRLECGLKGNLIAFIREGLAVTKPSRSLGSSQSLLHISKTGKHIEYAEVRRRRHGEAGFADRSLDGFHRVQSPYPRTDSYCSCNNEMEEGEMFVAHLTFRPDELQAPS